MNRREFLTSAVVMGSSASAVYVTVDGKDIPITELKQEMHSAVKPYSMSQHPQLNHFTPIREGNETLVEANLNNMRSIWAKSPDCQIMIGTGDKAVVDGIRDSLTPSEIEKVKFQWYHTPPPPNVTKEPVIIKNYNWNARKPPVQVFHGLQEVVKSFQQ